MKNQLEEIYKEIANKELDKKLSDSLIETYFCTRDWSAWDVGTMTQDDFELVLESDDFESDVINVMLGDVLEWHEVMRNQKGGHHPTSDSIECGRILDLWKKKRLPIEQQSPELIEYVHGLLNK